MQTFSKRLRSFLLLLLALAGTCVHAAMIEISVMPKIAYVADGYSDSNQRHYPVTFQNSPEAAHLAAKPYEDYCYESASAGKVCMESVNPHPLIDVGRRNNVYKYHLSDWQQCTSTGCTVLFPNGNGGPISIASQLLCPAGPAGTNEAGEPAFYDLTLLPADAEGEHAICVARIQDKQPCDDCDARGDPVHPSTGQQFLVERDYIDAGGKLDFTRTYRSTNSVFSSILTQRFITSSLQQETCLPGYWEHTGLQDIGTFCFPWVVHASQNPPYRLISSNGRDSSFDGSAAAVTAQSGVNDQVFSGKSPSGEIQWWVRKEANVFEVFSERGRLLRKVSADGLSDTQYAYSDASTPTAVAPGPGLLIKATERAGRALEFNYDVNARPISMRDPAKSLYEYGYDIAGNLNEVRYPDGARKSYLYEREFVNNGAGCTYYDGKGVPRPMTGVIDELRLRFTTFRYDCQLKAVSTEEAGGVFKYAFAYRTDSTRVNTTTETDPLGAIRLKRYEAIGSVMRPMGVSQTNPATGATESTTWVRDAGGNPVSLDTFNGNRICYENDRLRNLQLVRVEGLSREAMCSELTAIGAALPQGSRKTSTRWHPDWRMATKVADSGRIVTLVYNGQPDPFNSNALASCAPASAQLPDGKPIAVLCKQVEQATTDVNGSKGFDAAVQPGVANRVTTWTYNQYGQVLTEDGSRTDMADITRYAYYADTTADHTLGDLKQLTDASGKVTQFTKYNKHGQVLESKDPKGVVTVNTYDLRQHLLTSTVGPKKTTYAYDAAGQLKRVTDPGGDYVGMDYDDAHRLSAVYDNTGNRIEYTLDNAGNRKVEKIKDPGNLLRKQLQRGIDPLGRVKQTKFGQ